jgi:3-hydroxyisobutyrate dehydrogenase-like beta-hydroxyacid dehydrogenase
MGSALVAGFLNQGHPVVIWNRTQSKCRPLAALGAQIVPALLDAVSAAEMIVVNVTDYAASDQLLCSDEVTQALRGKLLVQLTSGTPRQAREMDAWARQHAISYLEGAIMAPPNLIGDEGCTILYSGPSALFEQYQAILLALGGNPVYLGSEIGRASALDNALLSIVWGTMFGVLQGAAVCAAEQFPLEAYLGSIQAVMPAIEASAVDIVQRIQGSDFAGETSLGTTALHSGGVQRLIALCQEHGINRRVPDAFAYLLQSAVSSGQGQDDFAVLSQFMAESQAAAQRPQSTPDMETYRDKPYHDTTGPRTDRRRHEWRLNPDISHCGDASRA